MTERREKTSFKTGLSCSIIRAANKPFLHSNLKLKTVTNLNLLLCLVPRRHCVSSVKSGKIRRVGHSELMVGDCVSPTTPRAPRPTKEQRKMTSQLKLVANKSRRSHCIRFFCFFVRWSNMMFMAITTVITTLMM